MAVVETRTKKKRRKKKKKIQNPLQRLSLNLALEKHLLVLLVVKVATIPLAQLEEKINLRLRLPKRVKLNRLLKSRKRKKRKMSLLQKKDFKENLRVLWENQG